MIARSAMLGPGAAVVDAPSLARWLVSDSWSVIKHFCIATELLDRELLLREAFLRPGSHSISSRWTRPLAGPDFLAAPSANHLVARPHRLWRLVALIGRAAQAGRRPRIIAGRVVGDHNGPPLSGQQH